MTEPRDARDERLPANASVTVAKVGPNDVIVMEHDGPLSQSAVARIMEQVEEAWPGRKCVVVCDGLKLKIARESDVVPRCDHCQWWGSGKNESPGFYPRTMRPCDAPTVERSYVVGWGMVTAPDFGCVQFTAKAKE